MTRVIKIGGRAQGDLQLSERIASAARTERLCVIHGGGDEVSMLMRQLGREPTFVNGRRVTTPEDVSVVQMVLSGAVNKRIVGQLLSVGVAAVGISGEDGGLLQARLYDGGSLGAVGEPESVNVTLLHVLLDAGFVPVISPLGRGPTGVTLNVNGDDAAAAIASAISADELLLVADVPGVFDESGDVVRELRREDVERLVATGAARGGMLAKLEAATCALQSGVRRVRIGDLDAISNDTAGTSVLLSTSAV